MDMEIVAEGLAFPEGPIAMSDGSVLLVEIRSGHLTRVGPTGRVERLVDVGGGPNGAAIGPDGAVYVVNNGGFSWKSSEVGVIPSGTARDYVGGSVQRVDLSTGKVTTLYTESEGIPLRGPNDIVFDAHGGFFFTDLAKWTEDVQQLGAIHYARADGTGIRAIRRGMMTPNGIGLSPDGGILYVAESLTGHLWAFDVVRPGNVSKPPGEWKPGRHVWSAVGLAMYDSLAVEADGRVCVATVIRGGIDVISADGRGCHSLPLPAAMTTNICFGGDDMQTAWITASNTGRLYRCRWPRPGLRLAFNV